MKIEGWSILPSYVSGEKGGSHCRAKWVVQLHIPGCYGKVMGEGWEEVATNHQQVAGQADRFGCFHCLSLITFFQMTERGREGERESWFQESFAKSSGSLTNSRKSRGLRKSCHLCACSVDPVMRGSQQHWDPQHSLSTSELHSLLSRGLLLLSLLQAPVKDWETRGQLWHYFELTFASKKMVVFLLSSEWDILQLE